MNTEALYELRVLSGEQRGASSVLQPGQTLRIGQDWSSEVVLQQAQGSAVLSFSAEGGLVLQAERGDCTVADHAVSPGGRDGLDLYIPFSVGGGAHGRWENGRVPVGGVVRWSDRVPEGIDAAGRG